MQLEQFTGCRWDTSSGAQRLIANPSLVQDLTQAAIQGLLALPKRGVEVGGLLFGQVRQEGETAVYEIVGWEEIPCEHRFGPSYVLDQSDRERFAEVMVRCGRDGSAPVVGFYRSYTGREARLDEADRDLLRAFFPSLSLACLLFRPLSIQKCDTSFQFWESGGSVPEAGLEPPARFEPLASFEPPASPESQGGFHPPPGAEAPEPGSLRLPGVLPLLCCLLAGMACASTYELWSLTHRPPAAAVRFDAAQQAAGDLLLSWDAANPAVSASTRGTLSITDGAYPFEIPLTPLQIHRGKLTYSPTSENASFHLRFYDKQREVADGSLRVIRTSGVEPVSAAVPEPEMRAVPRHESAGGHAPVAQHEVQPAISPGIRARIEQPTTVAVLVTVNESGRVTHAWSKTAGRDGLERYLIDEATKAAREWTFSPAQSKNGEPASATTTISFEFTPEK